MNKYKIFGYYFCDNCGHWFKTGCFLPGEKEDPEARLLYDDICPRCGAPSGAWYQCFPFWKDRLKEYLVSDKQWKLYKRTLNFLNQFDAPLKIRYSKYVGTLVIWAETKTGKLYGGTYKHLRWGRLDELHVGYKHGKVYMIKLQDADKVIQNIDNLELSKIRRELVKYVMNTRVRRFI